MRIFPHLRPGFTDAFRAPLARNPPSRHLLSPSPRYPCFALADLIRDSALNLVRYTAVCMPQLALPATSATYTYIYILSHPLLSSLPRILPIYVSFAHRNVYAKTHVHATPTYPGSSRLLFLPRFSREQRPLRAVCPLFSSFYPLTSKALSLSLFLLLSVFILCQRLHIFFVFLFIP